MAARTTRAYVATIIELDDTIVPDDTAMAAFITPANELVTECCTGDAGPDTAYDSTRLELIERWLAAHFYTVRDPRAQSEGAKGITASYQSKVGLGLSTSHYGQMAMRMDTNGGLAKLDADAKKGKPTAGAIWLGSEDTTVDIVA